MNNLRLKTKNNKNYILFFSVIFCLHLCMRTNFGDDSDYFLNILGKNSMAEFWKIRYHGWSSRLIIESVLVYLVHAPFVWKILDSLIYVLLAKTIAELLDLTGNEKGESLILSLLMLYPLTNMSSAGWMATTLNYLWVAAFMLYSLIPLSYILKKKKVTLFQWITCSLAALYASNQEQACACMCLIFFCALLILLFHPKYRKNHAGTGMILFLLVICMGNLLFILTCPGNANRSVHELSTSIDAVNYARYSSIDKIILGYKNSMVSIFSAKDFVLPLFLLVLLIAVIKRMGLCSLYSALLSLPFFISMLRFFPLESMYEILFITNSLPLTDNTNYMLKEPYASLLFWIFILLLILLSLLAISTDFSELMHMLFVLGCGLGSSMILGFSPSYAYSEKRTLIFFYFALIYCTVYITKKHLTFLSENKKAYQITRYALSSAVVIYLINTCLEIATM